MSVELHLPDLPEVPISIGPAGRARPVLPWHLRLRAAIVSALPLLLITLLALASWWLVKNAPRPQAPAAERPVSGDPDYTMTQFALERFDSAGRLKLRIEGDHLRHFPSTDRVEIEGARIRAFAPDGRVTVATAQRALANGDGSEIQLLGGAELSAEDSAGVPLLMRSEFLHIYLVGERIKTHLPVRLQQGETEIQAAGLSYDNATQRLDLKGPLRTVFAPRGRPAPPRP